MEPRPGTALDQCTPSGGNTQCWYPPMSGSALWRRCHCDGPFSVNLWACESTAHY